MAIISLGDWDYSVYFQCNAMNQARNWKKTNLLYKHLYLWMLHIQVEQDVDIVELWFVFYLGEQKGSMIDRLAQNLGGFWLQGVHYFPNISCILRVG